MFEVRQNVMDQTMDCFIQSATSDVKLNPPVETVDTVGGITNENNTLQHILFDSIEEGEGPDFSCGMRKINLKNRRLSTRIKNNLGFALTRGVTVHQLHDDFYVPEVKLRLSVRILLNAYLIERFSLYRVSMFY